MDEAQLLKLRQWAGKYLFATMGGLTIAMVVGVIYFPALKIGFWSDDYAFVETAARLPLEEYLVWYFDPRVQALWYRPIPGMLFWIEWLTFRGDARGYHLVYVLIHCANCLLLYALAARVTRRWHFGLVSAVVYAGLSVYSLAVMRPSDETALAALFYLLAILFWLSFLSEYRWRYYVLAFFSFILALFSKEASVTLPIMMFLVDRLLVGGQIQPKQLLKRYLPFALALIPYLIFEFTWLPDSQYRTNLGYGLGLHVFSILGEYLTRLAFPWGLNPSWNYLWLSFVAAVFALCIIKRRDRGLLFLLTGSLVTLAPYVPFQFVFPRFLYVPTMFSAMSIGALFIWLQKTLNLRWQTVALAGMLASLVIVNGLGTGNDIDWLNRFAREVRLPLRTVSQRHPNFPDDTLLYFIDPPVPLYSGMFFLRYGSQVSVGGDIGIYKSMWRSVLSEPAHLRRHSAAYVFYFDDGGEMKEQSVSLEDTTKVEPALPVNFQSAIQLEGYEIASARVRRGEALVLLLYWQATGKVNQDYTVFAHLLNGNGQMVAGVDHQPRNGNMPTHRWRMNERVVDWIIIPISDDIPSRSDYRLEFGWYDQTTLQRLGIIDSSEHVYSDGIIIEPLAVSD